MKFFTQKSNKGFIQHYFLHAKNSAGFTLLETLVAISVLSISIAGAFGVAQSGLSTAIRARDQIIAFQLAQEAIEHIKNVRDTNMYSQATNNSPRGWLTDLSQCIDTDCGLDVLTRNLSPCGQCVVSKNAGGYYLQGAGGVTPTVFTRRIRLGEANPSNPNLDQEVKISVTMSWVKGSSQNEFTVEEYMFNWQKGL